MSPFVPVHYEGAIFDWALVDEDDYERVAEFHERSGAWSDGTVPAGTGDASPHRASGAGATPRRSYFSRGQTYFARPKRVSLPPLEREVALATIWTVAA